MSDPDFNDFVDGALLASDADPSSWFDLSGHFRNGNPDFPINTIDAVRMRLAQLGLGKTYTETESPYRRLFKINPAGRAKAAEIKKKKQEISGQAHGVTVINNNNINVNPGISNSINVSSLSDSDSNKISKSSSRASWANVWVALVIGIATILSALWIGGKL